ncbi:MULTISPECIES: hypothetical protein [Asanoa]|uniref:Uncharacterized protein n=2 Tax=Asanoa TaxID=195964 RepID=A0A239PF88_9ACTN|nr:MULTISPECIES: hypothetical protein [Asanoa]GIF74166.1 hypothetical protein Asi02nite_36840 [Asanoa siamensis]SNT65682.1 hypothetical protein SAMN05421812_12525 [Asanoa hainanensis]
MSRTERVRSGAPLSVPHEWVSPAGCELCGRFHAGVCLNPVTASPAGLLTVSDALTPLGEVVDAAAEHLAVRHSYLDPEADEWPDWVLAELIVLWRAGPCEDCPVWNWKELAHHFMGWWQCEYERALPVWACRCGAVFKVCAAWDRAWDLYRPTADGLLGDAAGAVRLDSKGRVKRSDACPDCNRSFGGTVAEQADPQGCLF